MNFHYEVSRKEIEFPMIDVDSIKDRVNHCESIIRNKIEEIAESERKKNGVIKSLSCRKYLPTLSTLE